MLMKFGFGPRPAGTCACSQVSWSGRDGTADSRLGSDLEQSANGANATGFGWKLEAAASSCPRKIVLSYRSCALMVAFGTHISTERGFCLAKPSTAGSLGLCHSSSMKTLNSCQPASLRLCPASVSNHLHLSRAGPTSLCRIPASSSRLSAGHRKTANFR